MKRRSAVATGLAVVAFGLGSIASADASTGSNSPAQPQSGPISVDCSQVVQNIQKYRNLYNDAVAAYHRNPSKELAELAQSYLAKEQSYEAKFDSYCRS